MAEEAGAAFAPEHVPPFPVLTLHLDEAAETVSLDGAPVRCEHDQTLRDAGIAAVVAQLHARQLEAVRVRVTAPGGEEWRMIVTADAEVHDTTPPDEQTAHRKITRRRVLFGGGALALLAGGGTAAAMFGPRLLAPKPPAPWQPPGRGAQIPVATPPGFDQHAGWSKTVSRTSDLCQISSGHIGTVDEAGTLTLCHPETAKPAWRGANAPDAIHGAVRTRWDQHEVIAVASRTKLTVWPLSTDPTGAPTTPTSFTLDTGHRAEVRGPRPFVELTEWIVEMPTTNLGTRRITVPVGTRAALHERNGTMHTLDAGEVHHLHPDGTKAGTHPLGLKDRPASMPDGVWCVDQKTVLAAFDADGTRLVLIRPQDGAVLMDTTVSDRIDQRTDTRFLGAGCLWIGNTLVFTGGKPFARVLDDFTPNAAHGNTLFGTSQRSAATLNLRNDAEPQPWETYRADDPAPRIVTDHGAFIIAPQLDETVAYLAPRT